MFDFITVGTATRDIFLKSAAFKILEDIRFATGKAQCLTLGSKIEIDDIIVSTGGGATNAAVTFARQGFSAAAICRLGDDSGGRDVLEELKKENVAADFITSGSAYKTAYAVLLSALTGERTVLVYRGASDYFSANDINWAKLKTHWLYLTHLAGESAAIFEPLIDFAAGNKIRVAVNPGSTQLKLGTEKWKTLLKKINVIILNKEEAAELVGVDYQKTDEIFSAFDGLMDGIVVMTDGPNGVTVSDGKNRYKAGIYKEKGVVDRTGAGDAFGSGFVAGLARCLGERNVCEVSDIEYAIKLGSANATSVVEHIGAKEGILRREDFPGERWEILEIKKESL